MDNFIAKFKNKVKNRQLKIAVVGLGYVGLPLAMEFAKKGFSVYGIDLDKDRVSQLKRKVSYITDVPSNDVKRLTISKKFQADTNFGLLKQTDVIFICVPTPLKRKYQPNISYITSAVSSISKNRKDRALIILESTTYPGTTEEVILPMLEKDGSRHGKDFYLCFSPERIDPGSSFLLRKIPKVAGGIDRLATELTALIYKAIFDKVVPVSSARVAEMVKLLENTFRLINIGLIDELAMMAHKMDIDIFEVINAAKTKPFGFMPFYPGPGVGGHCIPKDPLYLYWKAKHHGFRSRFIKLASDTINDMPGYVVKRVELELAKKKIKLSNARVLIVGVTYKKDVKDLRKSPALDIIEILRNKRANVSYYDPLIPYIKVFSLNLKSVALTKDSVSAYDCVIIATDHSRVDYGLLHRQANLIFDARNVYAGVEAENIKRI
ncbi:MAG: nucleotide sugar dehydrogenase [Candidatus Omnitrophica bacterium]|nr:nucleotide sugar dehydrogenase [Candidatus Omnitrophota bacterium]